MFYSVQYMLLYPKIVTLIIKIRSVRVPAIILDPVTINEFVYYTNHAPHHYSSGRFQAICPLLHVRLGPLCQCYLKFLFSRVRLSQYKTCSLPLGRPTANINAYFHSIGLPEISLWEPQISLLLRQRRVCVYISSMK